MQKDLKEASRGTTSGGRQRSLRALVVAEFAFTLVLLVGAGLFLRSFLSVLDVDPGFRPEGTLGFDLVFPDATYPEPGDRMAFIDQLHERLGALPGIDEVGAGTFLPLSRAGRTEFLSRAEREEVTDYLVGANFISGSYFAATGMDLLRGRAFQRGDFATDAERVAVIDQGVANDLYPGEDPIGQSVRFLHESWRIVGVVSPVRHWQLDDVPRPFIYAPQSYSPLSTSFILRSTLTPASLSQMIRDTVRGVDSGQAVANIRTLEEAVETSLFARRVTLTLLSLFAGLGVLLAAIGIYGVMAYVVSQRDRELAIRTAFGAKRRDLVGLVVKDGLGPTFWGIALGLAGALVGARLIESQLFEIQAHDPAVLAISMALLSTVAVGAILLPAYRVARADPSRVIRSE